MAGLLFVFSEKFKSDYVVFLDKNLMINCRLKFFTLFLLFFIYFELFLGKKILLIQHVSRKSFNAMKDGFRP